MRVCNIAVAALLLTTVLAPVSGQARQADVPAGAASCGAAGDGVVDHRALAWSDYEFGQIRGLPMELAGRKCFAEAAEVSRDYLAFGPLLTTRQQAITTFHMGRNLAFAGREAEAAVAVAAARRSDQMAGQLDWNSYVRGVYAFLVKDPETLDSVLHTLAGSQGEGDRINAANLARLKTCFTRSYLDAMTDEACAAGGTLEP